MVIETNQAGIYLHAAYATDENGTDFSLTNFTGAVYVGNYMDRSSTESTNPKKYTWKPIFSDSVDPDDIEDDSEAYESVDVSDVQDAVQVVSAAAAALKVRTDYNDDNIGKTQGTQDEGLGNLNLLVGTNQGDDNWTSINATLTSVTEAVYSDDPNDEIDTMLATLTTPSDTFSFDSTKLLDFIAANDEDENTYTLSYDIKVSNINATIGITVPGVLVFESPSFIDDPDEDLSDTWLHFTSTAQISSTSGTDLQFIYAGASSDTVQIANLKIEAGALATPWRASLEEVEGVANTALSTANTANTNATSALNAVTSVSNYFWHDSNGAHVTEVTRATYEADPTTAGGNTLITSTGMEVRDGTTALASFGSSGAQVGQSASGHTTISTNGMQIYGGTGGQTQIANLGYGPGRDAQGSTSTAPYYTLGTRLGVVGNYSTAEGYEAEASGYSSHAEGFSTKSSGSGAHAEGSITIASGDRSHAQNYGTIAASDSQTALGKYNLSDANDTYAVIVGNGLADLIRSNALTVDWSGNVDAAGTVTVSRDPTANLEVATKQYVDNSGGGGGTLTHETIRNGISITTTSTNYGTNSISLSDYKFIEIRVYSSSAMSSEVYPIETVKAQVNGTYINHGQVCRLGTTNVYLTWKYNDDTHLQMNVNTGSSYYVGIFGIKQS